MKRDKLQTGDTVVYAPSGVECKVVDVDPWSVYINNPATGLTTRWNTEVLSLFHPALKVIQ